jgi:hypothetical protein
MKLRTSSRSWSLSSLMGGEPVRQGCLRVKATLALNSTAPRTQSWSARRWIASSARSRSDYADVAIEPPLDPTESGASEALTRVILAPRHRGVTLKSLTQFPADVYVATAPEALLEADTVQPDALKIRIWAVLEGAIQGA